MAAQLCWPRRNHRNNGGRRGIVPFSTRKANAFARYVEQLTGRVAASFRRRSSKARNMAGGNNSGRVAAERSRPIAHHQYQFASPNVGIVALQVVEGIARRE